MTEEYVIEIPDDHKPRIVDRESLVRTFDLFERSIKMMKLRDEKT
jgi:hypothetical protein